MLLAIFYARFHPDRGNCILHQYPPNSIIAAPAPPPASPSAPPSSHNDDATTTTAPTVTANNETITKPLIADFSDISPYIIPPHDVCNRPLSICTGDSSLRILGYPVSLEDAKYERNRFIFNVCFVFDEDDNESSEGESDISAWDAVVRKTGLFFQQLEEDEGLLRKEEGLDGLRWAGEEDYPAREVGVLYAVLEQVWEQMNAYGEACVKVDEAHILNLRLSRPREAPKEVEMWDVPLLIREIPSLELWSPDLILTRILPHIDGIKHVQCIGEVADVDTTLVSRAVQDLVSNDCALLLDIFHFQAVYSTTQDFAWFVSDEEMLDECAAYISTSPSSTKPTHNTLITLYRHLSIGQSLEDFCRAYSTDLSGIDIRRFITFGVIKGFLRRLHKYPLAVDSQANTPRPAHTTPSGTALAPAKSIEFYDDAAWRTAAFSSGWPTPPATDTSNDTRVAKEGIDDSAKLAGFLDGKHCMDEVCVAMRMGEKSVVRELRSGKFGDVLFVTR